MKPDPAKLANLTVEERRKRYVETIIAAGGRHSQEHYEKLAEKMYPNHPSDREPMQQ